MVISKLKIISYSIAILIGIGIGYLIFANKTERITTPPIYGEFKPAIPLSQKPIGEPLIVTWKTEKEIIYVETEGEVNDSLIKKFTDSITTLEERLQLFTDAVTYRSFSHTFEDEYLKATIEGITQGYLENVSIPSYEIKSREVEVPVKRFGIGIQAGYGIGQDLTLKPYIGVGLSYSIWEF